jgi:hypothetical protein
VELLDPGTTGGGCVTAKRADRHGFESAQSNRHLTALLAAALLAGVTDAFSPAPAASAGCVKRYKRDAADCIRDECTGLRGTEKRSCKANCRGRSGFTHPPIGTLAYVVTECRLLPDPDRLLDERRYTFGQSLHIRRGNCDDVTISYCRGGANVGRPCLEDSDCEGGVCGGGFLSDDGGGGGCRLLADYRLGSPFQVAGVFQRFGVSPDGSIVVFEVAAHLGLSTSIEEERKEFEAAAERLGNFGTYSVRADGSGLRRLGGASRAGPWDQVLPSSAELPGGGFMGYRGFNFSPNGRTVVLTDLDDTGAAFQVVTLDLASGDRKVLTRLPPAPSLCPTRDLRIPRPGGTPAFIDDERILFYTFAKNEGPADDICSGTCEPQAAACVHELTYMKVRTDGSGLKLLRPPFPSGTDIAPRFSIFARPRNLLTLFTDEPPKKPHPIVEGLSGSRATEVYVNSGKDLLQLTIFGRDDTFAGTVAADGRRALFVASHNRHGRNPTENCQLFSVDVISGGRIRQLTTFREVEEGAISARGCLAGSKSEGCRLGQVLEDPTSGTLLFGSSCDPFETGLDGEQIFAIRPDGSGLAQLTHTRGRVDSADGSVTIELPGPWGYSTLVQLEDELGGIVTGSSP